MVLPREGGKPVHRMISDLPEYIDKNTLVVLNNSRVRKARIYGESENGGKVEFLLLERRENGIWLAMVSKAKKQKPGKTFNFPGNIKGEIISVEGAYRTVKFSSSVTDEYLDMEGHIPLPPYIRREDCPEDAERYQTVYSEHMGSVAAPTAGLHFTDEILEKVRNKAWGMAFVTLHVGLGTFIPVRTEHITDHKMHTESYGISRETSDLVNRAVSEGKKILAVGTTSVRTLESAFKDGMLQPGEGVTDIFIYPGYKFKVVERLLTNFHTPESSLLMLVSAFAGKDNIFNAYETAVKEKYRFFSYGDAMLIG